MRRALVRKGGRGWYADAANTSACFQPCPCLDKQLQAFASETIQQCPAQLIPPHTWMRSWKSEGLGAFSSVTGTRR